MVVPELKVVRLQHHFLELCGVGVLSGAVEGVAFATCGVDSFVVVLRQPERPLVPRVGQPKLGLPREALFARVAAEPPSIVGVCLCVVDCQLYKALQMYRPGVAAATTPPLDHFSFVTEANCALPTHGLDLVSVAVSKCRLWRGGGGANIGVGIGGHCGGPSTGDTAWRIRLAPVPDRPAANPTYRLTRTTVPLLGPGQFLSFFSLTDGAQI